MLYPHDAGGKSRWPLLPGCRGSVAFGDERKEHRLWLERDWSAELSHELKVSYALFIGCNPSTGDADEDDMTIRKNIAFTRRLDLARLVMMNFVTFRATNPKDLSLRAGDGLTMEENFRYMLNIALEAREVVIASGDPPAVVKPYALAGMRMLMREGVILRSLGRTRAGWPKHTSRLSYQASLMPFALPLA